jgi:hypothetical protein
MSDGSINNDTGNRGGNDGVDADSGISIGTRFLPTFEAATLGFQSAYELTSLHPMSDLQIFWKELAGTRSPDL